MKPRVLQVAAIDMSLYKFVLPLMKQLREEGFEVSCACKNLGILSKIEEEGFTSYNVNIDRKISPISNLKTIIELYRILKKDQIDIVHLHTPIAAVLGRIAAKLAGVKTIIYTAHGYYKENPFFYYTEKIMAKFFTDYIFTVNQEDLEMAVENGFISKTKITNINGVGIDTKKFDPTVVDEETKTELRRSLGISQQDVIIGFIGRLVKIKGPIDLLHAFIQIKDKYPDTKLLMIGSWEFGERDLKTKDTLIQMIEDYQLQDRVIFTGHREDIPELLSIMDLFILPSYWEGMPVSLLEAMAMERPVIGTDIRGSREEIDAESGLIFPPGDIQALAASIEKMLADPEKAKMMGKKARERVVNYFSEEQSLEKQMNVYRKLKEEVKG